MRRGRLFGAHELRKARPAPISGLDTLLAVQISFYDDPARFALKTNEPCLRQLFAETLGVSVTVPDNPKILGALGAALYAAQAKN